MCFITKHKYIIIVYSDSYQYYSFPLAIYLNCAYVASCTMHLLLLLLHMGQYFGKLTIHTQELKSIFCLYMIDTLMHYSETPSARIQIARFAFTDGFLPCC